jgi:hypothetical protein
MACPKLGVFMNKIDRQLELPVVKSLTNKVNHKGAG